MTTTLSLTEMRPRLPEIIDRAVGFFDRFIITRRGRGEAVLLALDDYEGLMETLEILSDNETVRRIAAAEKEFRSGDGHSLDAIRRELLDEQTAD